MNKSFDWDVFLSHSSIDKPRVARLAERLTAAGFRVWVAPTSIALGQDVYTEIEDGLERSRVLILCMSKAAFESEWVRLERNTATFRDPGNQDRRFLPLRLDDCQIPATLRRLQFIDWRHESEAAWQQLLATLRSESGRLPEGRGGQRAFDDGLREKDIIIAAAGEPIRMNSRQFQSHLKLNYKVGEQLPLTILRDGKKTELKITFVE